MIHTGHRIHIYRKHHHRLTAALTLLAPLLLLALLGGLARADFFLLLGALGLSVFRLALGYSISLILGITIAVMFGTSKMGDALIPIFDVMQNVPSFALIPVFALFFGYTNLMAIIFIATSVLWPILFYTLHAIRSARNDLNDAATIFGATGFKRVWNYLIPLSWPAIITGSIVGISIGWEAVIGIEIIGFKSGVGVFLNNASAGGRSAVLTAGIAAILILVFVINKLVWVPLLKKTEYYGE